jgi:NAD(P)-dependent dehydrogenase (short-subunit alcohol dehydrogenase family)
MARELDGKAAMVLGAGSIGPGWGNGKATAVLMAREGAAVVCVDRNLAAAEETAALIEAEGGTAHAFEADVTVTEQVRRAVAFTIERLGRIDILDNNVGIAEVGGVVELAEDDWDRLFAINLKSCYLAMKHVIPVMARQGGGAIVNISSIASLRYTGVPYATYYATKAAMNHLTRTTALEYARAQIRVNAVLPGLMKTPMVEHSSGLAEAYGDGDIDEMWRARAEQCPMGYMGDAWDVAHAVVYLASDRARYVTGIELVVDGGLVHQIA